MRRDRLAIALMQPGDIAEVLALEAEALTAWSREHLEDELRQPSGFQFVVRTGAAEAIIAFVCGRVAADEAEILKLHVAQKARRKGIGYELLDFALQHCRRIGAAQCFLELRASNTAAGNLYQKRGFLPVGCRKAYYNDPVEDAVLMQLEL